MMSNLFVSVFHTGLIASMLLAFALALYMYHAEQQPEAAVLVRRRPALPQPVGQANFRREHDPAYPADLYNIVVIDLTCDEERFLHEIEGR